MKTWISCIPFVALVLAVPSYVGFHRERIRFCYPVLFSSVEQINHRSRSAGGVGYSWISCDATWLTYITAAEAEQTTRCGPAFQRNSWMWSAVNLWHAFSNVGLGTEEHADGVTQSHMTWTCLPAFALDCTVVAAVVVEPVKRADRSHETRQEREGSPGIACCVHRCSRHRGGACEEHARESQECCEVDLYTSHSCRSYYHDDESACWPCSAR
jgi:hypothetical protein